MLLVFGIGNPGAGYAGTRHNLGFAVVDLLAADAGRNGRPLSDPVVNADGVRLELEGRPALLLKPLSFVNRCGPVLAAALGRAECDPKTDLLVVVDDLALPPGRLRLRSQGSDGGHNGLRSIIASLETEAFARLRIGIGDPGEMPAERYVLQPFPPSERATAVAAVARAADAVRLWARLGTDRAMGEVNRRDLDQGQNPP